MLRLLVNYRPYLIVESSCPEIPCYTIIQKKDESPKKLSDTHFCLCAGGFVMKSILDSSFKYTPSIHTDVRETFCRIRREQEAQLGAQEQPEIPQEHASEHSSGVASILKLSRRRRR